MSISPISTKRTKTPTGGARLLIAVALLLAPASANDAVRQALDGMFRMDYPAAEASVLEDLPAASPAAAPLRFFYAGVVCLNRFSDWGDTAALARAERYWEPLDPRHEAPATFRNTDPAELRLYRGLAGFQLSYIASLRGQRLRSASLAFAARKQLLPLGRPEARATLMLYSYYKDQMVGKLPFVGEADFPVGPFRALADSSPGLRDMLLTSLFWIQLDNKRPEPALRIAEAFLERYPGNRLGREMRGAALYRAGRLPEARAECERLLADFAGLKKTPERLPLGYFRLVANLARVYDALGLRAEAREKRAEWNRAGSSGVGPWLPGSLKRDMEKL